jgi:hypothetical protein
MSDEASGASRVPARAGKDRTVKIAFLAVTMIAVGAIYYIQRNPPLLKNWSEDLGVSLANARAGGQRVLVLFLPSELSDHDRRWLVGGTISKNEPRIDDGRFLRVKVPVAEIKDCEPARTYGIKTLPTVLMLGADGKELGRLEGSKGMIGETALTAFLTDANSQTR